MNNMLVCVGGEHKGSLWMVSSVPLVIGRSGECDVALSGPLVSRRHCQLFLEGDRIVFEDLGSRNKALVNGQAVTRKDLSPGDEILLGRDHFVLAGFADRSVVGAPEETPLPKTMNWEQIASAQDDRSMERIRPRTVQDLAELYAAVCEFSGCGDPDSLLEAVSRRLRQYFNAETVRVMLEPPGPSAYGTEPSSCGGNGSSDAPELHSLLESCMTRRRALLERSGAPGSGQRELLTYAAPVYYDEALLARIVVQTHTDGHVHPEGGLHFLALFARSLGPVLYGVLQRAALREENERFRIRAGQSHTLIGHSAVMEQVRLQIQQAARANINVLITGETGSGKELAVRALHHQSKRSRGPLVVVNCAAIPRELFESELFGHTAGAFTGAVSASPGLLLQADGGALFLDEIGDLSPENQARILRVVETQSFRPVGAGRETRVDVRIVAATHQDLEAAVRQGRFREDLLHRLKGIEIPMPPLREHAEDIPVLAEYFRVMCQEAEEPANKTFAPGAVEALQEYSWPGNVRELRQTIHRAMALSQRDVIGADDLFPQKQEAVVTQQPSLEATTTLSDMKKHHIEDVLRQHRGNVSRSAKSLGISRTTLYAKIDEYGIRV